MKKPDYISLDNYHYPLPDNRIAKYPLAQRDKSKLLVYKNDRISSLQFSNLPDVIPANAHMVLNETRVIHARLIFRKTSGAKIEIFCLEPLMPSEYQLNFSSQESVKWKCLIGNQKKWKSGILQMISEDGIQLNAEKFKNTENENIIEFSWSDKRKSFSEIIQMFGSTPIPPYLNRNAEESDSHTYQTVYSKNEGSVAAPTAGLHFTEAVLRSLKEKNIEESFLTLHVGAGTFVPVKSENAVDHNMHVERIIFSKKTIFSLLNNNHFIVPVGTTSCRSLESLYWIGVQIISSVFNPQNPYLSQWGVYELDDKYSRQEILKCIYDYMEEMNLEKITASTGIMITPGYSFKMTDALITNFHQPSSTLLMLISALTGEKWRDIYDYALKNDFRFLSYGDSNLLFPNNTNIALSTLNKQ